MENERLSLIYGILNLMSFYPTLLGDVNLINKSTLELRDYFYNCKQIIMEY